MRIGIWNGPHGVEIEEGSKNMLIYKDIAEVINKALVAIYLDPKTIADAMLEACDEG